MFVFNMKLDGNKTSKALMGVFCVILLFVTAFICYKLISNSFFKTNDEVSASNDTIYEITPQNYTNILQNVHNNIDNYIGQKIKFSGYIYRLYNFSDEQFVLARNMIVSSDFQTVVVGFLCHYKQAINYEDNCWVEIIGTITKGDYNGEMPIIEIETIKKVDTPSEEFVYPPDSSFVTTSTIL